MTTITIAQTPTDELRVYLERLESEALLAHNRRVTQTIKVKIAAIRYTLKERDK